MVYLAFRSLLTGRANIKINQSFPLIGATKVNQLQDVLDCLTFEIPADAMKQLNEVSQIELPFPQKFLTEPGVLDVLYGGMKDSMKDSRY